jgi:hypothetical protein
LRNVGVAGFDQQPLNDPLRSIVFAFTEVMVAGMALRIDEVVRRPIFVVERAPDLVFVVDRDRIADLQICDRFADIVDVALEGELRRVDADDDKAVILVLLRPCVHIRDGAQAVDAGIGPEVEHDHLALEALAREWR